VSVVGVNDGEELIRHCSNHYMPIDRLRARGYSSISNR
jgi:hypothetical protein